MRVGIFGPCVHEHSVQWLVEQAEAIREQIPPGWAFVFKTSFDKANRTRHDSFRGLGLDATLTAFDLIKRRMSCLVTTDIHEAWQAKELGPIVDVIQIPAALSRQTDLIVAAARTARCVNFKCGTNTSVDKMSAQVVKAYCHGAPSAWLTYRGTAYGDQLVFDPMRLWNLSRHASVIADITHSAQAGAGIETKGTPSATLVYGRTAMALGCVDGLFAECHPEPSSALSDSATQIPIRNLGKLLQGVTHGREV